MAISRGRRLCLIALLCGALLALALAPAAALATLFPLSDPADQIAIDPGYSTTQSTSPVQ